MRVAAQFKHQCAVLSIVLALAVPFFAQNRHGSSAPRSSPPPQRSSRPAAPQPRYQSPPRNYQPAPRQNAPRENAPRQNEIPRPYQPPAQGHHSGQWLNQHREQPLDQQRRALESDPTFRRLPPQRQQQLEQRLQHFNSMPADRQQQVLRRMETWEHLTSAQKQQFRSVDSQFRALPPGRQQAVRNAIQTLRAMPPEARERAIGSGRFNQFSPQEQQILNNAARLPLAPAQPNASRPEPPQSQQSGTGPQRYIPRPPR